MCKVCKVHTKSEMIFVVTVRIYGLYSPQHGKWYHNTQNKCTQHDQAWRKLFDRARTTFSKCYQAQLFFFCIIHIQLHNYSYSEWNLRTDTIIAKDRTKLGR